MTVRSLRRDIALAAAWTAFVVLMLLGPGADPSEAATCTGAGTPAYELGSRAARHATLCLLNRERAARGMKPLRVDGKQQKAASGHNRTMIRDRCFSHQCSGERDLVGRIEDSGYLPCSCTWSVGENIAWGSGSLASPQKIVQAWMDSPSHRANVLDRHFDEVGLGIDAGSAAGMDDSATYTADFGHKD
jgi:uncharacterized protein YkwD